MTNSISEVAGADFILAWGTNTFECHPVIGYKVVAAVRGGAKLVVVDPRKTDLAKMADEHVRLKPGTDIALLNGLMHVILAEGLWNHEFVETRTENFEALKQLTVRYTPEYVEDITGVPAEQIRRVARGYAGAGSASILYTMGVTQHICGTHNVFSVANLAMLCGQIGRESTGVNPLRGQNNVQGACDMGALPNVLTGYQAIVDEATRDKFGSAWECVVPSKPGLTVGEMMAAIGRREIKALFVMGENLAMSDPDIGHVEQALGYLELFVVQDIFLSETARQAHVVLPAACFAEKDGTFTNTERRVQRVRKAVEPPGQALADWEIITRLSTVMGYPMNYSSPEEIFTEMAALTPSYAGISYHRLEKNGIQWPCPNTDHPGTPILHQSKFSRGLGRFNPVEHIPPDETPDGEFPLVLSTGRRLYHYHTGTMSRKGMLGEYLASDWLEINPADALKLEVSSGDLVRVRSRRGSVDLVARVSDIVPPGMVFCSFHFAESAVNRLTNPVLDPVSKIPEYKVCAVRVEKVNDQLQIS